MQSPKEFEQLYLMCMARKNMCITLPIVLQSFLFITQEEDLGENYLQNPKSQRMENVERERNQVT
jgi:hypothetical protein